mgnify:CR=1 FL=1
MPQAYCVKDKAKVEVKVEAKIEMLQRQLAQRFGPLPQDVAKKIRGARLADLDRWLLRVLDASSLQSVFTRR